MKKLESRRKFLKGSALAATATAGTLAAPAIVKAAPTVLKMQAAWGGGIFLKNAQSYVDRVNAMAGDALQIVGGNPGRKLLALAGYQRRRLAEAAGDHVGHRGDALDPPHPHQLAQDPPPADQHQGRAKIDRREFQARPRSVADGAVKRP